MFSLCRVNHRSRNISLFLAVESGPWFTSSLRCNLDLVHSHCLPWLKALFYYRPQPLSMDSNGEEEGRGTSLLFVKCQGLQVLTPGSEKESACESLPRPPDAHLWHSIIYPLRSLNLVPLIPIPHSIFYSYSPKYVPRSLLLISMSCNVGDGNDSFMTLSCNRLAPALTSYPPPIAAPGVLSCHLIQISSCSLSKPLWTWPGKAFHAVMPKTFSALRI